ncbi:hypothetical protein F3N42_09505 [Marinihelvus fidelis]|uniref:Uncharacterized protein n=1 Tax=Marinihelvus fidelis TaxID=2613842 RepID=A0A5N0T923_9GAMM|nr:HEPN domain-containing protein [Marinihelvus fidelis]KAA9131543.1 hypothetical protein F3N42_09505 [Marinihelvus fidelis]
MNSLNYQTLKARHRAERDGYSPALALRTHRALSWLQRAEQETEDQDARFIFAWIALNAAYARDQVAGRVSWTERRRFREFIRRLLATDSAGAGQNLLYNLVWDQFPNSIRGFLDNQYVFQPYWEHQKGNLDEAAWKQSFSHSKTRAYRALGQQRTGQVLGELFDRLYTLRNQLIHGGATWNGQINRKQVTAGADILGKLVPVVIHLMMARPGVEWEMGCYPVVG